jgi:hypothetical protein
MASRRDLKIIKGSTFNLMFRLKSRDEAGGDTAINLTGSTVALRMETASEEWEYATGADSEIVISGASAGEVTFTLSAAETATFPSPRTRCKWSLELRTADEDRTLVVGNVTLIDWANP